MIATACVLFDFLADDLILVITFLEYRAGLLLAKWSRLAA
jgi:hypothetical protein